MKGVILAGGSGSRLAPLTRITNKHLLPLYDRPMVTYAVEALVEAGFTELMLVTGGTHAGEFFRLLGNGHEYGIERLFYAYCIECHGRDGRGSWRAALFLHDLHLVFYFRDCRFHIATVMWNAFVKHGSAKNLSAER